MVGYFGQTFTIASEKTSLIKEEKQVDKRKKEEQEEDHKDKENRPVSSNPPIRENTTFTMTPHTEVAGTLPSH